MCRLYKDAENGRDVLTGHRGSCLGRTLERGAVMTCRGKVVMGFVVSAAWKQPAVYVLSLRLAVRVQVAGGHVYC